MMLQMSLGTTSPFGQETTRGFPRTHHRATSIGRGSDFIPADIIAFTNAPVPVDGLYSLSMSAPFQVHQIDGLAEPHRIEKGLL